MTHLAIESFPVGSDLRMILVLIGNHIAVKDNIFHPAIAVEQEVVYREKEFHLSPLCFRISGNFKYTIVKYKYVADTIRTHDVGVALPEIDAITTFMDDVIKHKYAVNRGEAVSGYK